MNDSEDDFTPSCRAHAQDISLLAADCLDADEERTLRLHLDVCAACRLRYEQSVEVVGGLRKAASPVEATRFQTWAPPKVELAAEASAKRATSSTLRRRIVRIAVVAAVVTLVIGGLSRVGDWHSTVNVPAPAEVARDFPGDEVDESAPLPIPTLLALRRAAVESDESLDRLLARDSESILAVSHDTRLLSLEHLP